MFWLGLCLGSILGVFSISLVTVPRTSELYYKINKLEAEVKKNKAVSDE